MSSYWVCFTLKQKHFCVSAKMNSIVFGCSQAEKLNEKFGSYAAAEHSFFMSLEEPLWPTPAGAPFSAVPQVPGKGRSKKNCNHVTGSNRGSGEGACCAEAAACSSDGALESALGQLMARIEAVEDTTDVFRLHDDLRNLNLALVGRARGAA